VAGAATINYGIFVNTILDFLIAAFAVFLLIKQINRLKRQEQPALAAPTPGTALSAFRLSLSRQHAVLSAHRN
jgi:large conductance mechanosensitive channel